MINKPPETNLNSLWLFSSISRMPLTRQLTPGELCVSLNMIEAGQDISDVANVVKKSRVKNYSMQNNQTKLTAFPRSSRSMTFIQVKL